MDIRKNYLSDEEADRLYSKFPQLGSDPTIYCPTCDKKGSYTWKGEERQCDCVMQLQLMKHYLAAGVGTRYQRLGWADLKDQSAIKIANQYLDAELHRKGIGLLFTGGYGSGKTLTATLVLKDLVKKGYSCYSTTFASMIEFYTAGWKDPEEKKYYAKKVVQSDVLLLDDLGRELRTSTRLSESTFDDVLRTRVQGGRPTFITTNMDESELGHGYGGAALSLIREVSLPKTFTGSDFRPRVATRNLNEALAGETRPIQ